MNAATNTKKCVIPMFKSPIDYQVYRINPQSTNWLAIVFDQMNTCISLTYCAEIFDVSGKTPPDLTLNGGGNVFCQAVMPHL